jgi:hypothetical protein
MQSLHVSVSVQRADSLLPYMAVGVTPRLDIKCSYPIPEPVRPVCVATLSLNHEEAEALAGRLATALGQGGQDPAAVLPALSR